MEQKLSEALMEALMLAKGAMQHGNTLLGAWHIGAQEKSRFDHAIREIDRTSTAGMPAPQACAALVDLQLQTLQHGNAFLNGWWTGKYDKARFDAAVLALSALNLAPT